MNYFNELSQVLSRIDPAPLLAFVRGCEGTLWVAGNGGSASTAQHWACDLSKAAGRRAQALGSNPAVLTAWANDDDYALALANEFDLLARPNDRLICLSCSGTSKNIVALLWHAKNGRIPRALVTGDKKPMMTWLDVLVSVPHTSYGIIEDATSAIGHWLTEELQK